MKRTLKKIIDFAVEIAEPEEIILFGSMADETANHFSDVDLLVISQNTEIKDYISEKIVNYSSELSLKTDVLLYSRAQIERECQQPNSFIAAIIKSGNITYKKACNLSGKGVN